MIEWLWFLVAPTGAVFPDARFKTETECIEISVEIDKRNNRMRNDYWTCVQMPVIAHDEQT